MNTPSKSLTEIEPQLAPRAFMSYCWEGEEHNQWVRKLAERLRQDGGIDIVFDQWNLMPGNDKQHFMEQIATCDFVILICTIAYAERANKRAGGVGYESMVITSELAQNILSNKFIPILRSGEWNSSLPNYMKSKVGLDLRNNPYSETQYKRLVDALHKEPIQPPPLGPKPSDLKVPITAQSAASASNRSPTITSLLGHLNERPVIKVEAVYIKKERPTSPGQSFMEHAFIRLWAENGELYSFENSLGEEHLGTKLEAMNLFTAFKNRLIAEGYHRSNFFSSSDPEFGVL